MINKILELGFYKKENENRAKITILSSIVGIILNFSLCLIKIILFWISGSISILADSINNLTDSISSLVTLVGAKLSVKQSDEVHPYGYGRLEYVSGLVVSILVFVMGFEFLRISIERIIEPKPLKFSYISIYLMLFSILIKIYMVYFFSRVAKAIDSLPMKAQARDYLGDVIITSLIVVSIFVYKLTNIFVDGYVGVMVSFFILYSAYDLTRDTISHLIGQGPKEFIFDLENRILSYEGILGVHDIIISNFGPSNVYVSLDVEIDYKMSLVDAHALIDRIERHIEKEFSCTISIHVDPVGMYSEEEKRIEKIMKNYINKDNRIWSFHDLKYEKNLVRLDLVVDGNKINEKEADKIGQDLKKFLSKEIPCEYEINMDRYFK